MSAENDGKNISVSVSGDTGTLSGNAHTFSDISDAGQAAWSAPGVMMIENKLKLAHEWWSSFSVASTHDERRRPHPERVTYGYEKFFVRTSHIDRFIHFYWILCFPRIYRGEKV